MAVIPADPVSTVRPDIAATPYQSPNVNQGAFGGQVAQAVQGLGQSGVQAADAATEIAIRQAQIHNESVVADAYTRYQQTLNRIQYGDPSDPNSRGYMGLQGRDALDGYQGAVQSLEAARIQVRSSLESPAQQQAFDQDSRRLMTYTASSFGAHRAQQQMVWANQVQDAAAQSSAQAAVAAGGDDTAFNLHLQDGMNAIVTKGQQAGWAPDVIQQQVADYRSKTWAERVDRQAISDPMGAWNLYQQHQAVLSGTDQLALEHRLKPQVQAWQSRVDADNIMGTGGRLSPIGPAAPMVAQEAQAQGVGTSLALTTASIESGCGQVPDRPGSQVKGVFQMTPATWAARGGTDANRSDVAAQCRFGVANLKHSQQVAQQALGGQPAADWQTYVVHQQGDAGGAALLKADPTESAVAALAPAYGGNAAAARQAIVANGGSADMTAGQFLSMWQGKYAAAAAKVGQAAVQPPDVRGLVPGWLAQAQSVRDPFGADDPVYQDMVVQRIRGRVGEIEYAQAQQDRANRETLLSAAMGVPSLAASDGSQAGQQAQKPTTLDQLFQANPNARTAFAVAMPEVQRGVMAMLEHNARGEDPPMSQGAMDKYYQLLGEANTDRAAFQKENLADPALFNLLPRNLLLGLMHEQQRPDARNLVDQQKQESLLHAQQVLTPDMLASGIKVTGAKPSSADATQLQQFTGRLSEALDQFQATNKRRPTDEEVKKLGQGLLMQGTIRGSGWLWDTQERLFQAESEGKVGSFEPTVPATDRAQIIAAYKATHQGALPSDSQIGQYYALGQGRSRSAGSPTSVTPAPGAVRTVPHPLTAPAPAAAAPSAPVAASAAPSTSAAARTVTPNLLDGTLQ